MASTAQADQAAANLPPDQLDSLVAPIALYPDPLLSQTLVASTYPLEIVQLKQWLDQHKDLKDKALAAAVEKEDWDPSIQAMAGLPDVVKLLADNLKWTTDLGNAFLAQQSDVMEAVQRMRKKAQGLRKPEVHGTAKGRTKVVESQQVIVVEQANPQVVYVPSYNPTVVYGAPVYAYPPIAYPPPGYYAAGMAISFGVGVAMGAMWGGGWGYNCGWGGNNNVTINNNNNFVNNSNRQNIGNGNRGNGNRPSNQPARGNSNWQHNPQHRGGAPYSNRATANKYGGTTRGDSMQNRQANARQNQARQGVRQGAIPRTAAAAAPEHETPRIAAGRTPGRETLRTAAAAPMPTAVVTALGTSASRIARARQTKAPSAGRPRAPAAARPARAAPVAPPAWADRAAAVAPVAVAAGGGDKAGQP